MVKKPKTEELKRMALEVIAFLKGWGLWRDTMILAAGNRYSYSSNKDDVYEGMTNVSYEENVDPEEYTRGLTNAPGGNADLIWKSLGNPAHIYDMVYEGPLHMLLRHDVYEPDLSCLSEEAWKYIFANTELIWDHIMTEYEVSDPVELGEHMWAQLFDNPDLTYWDPLVFDTWEEYLDMYGGDDVEKIPAYTNVDTYEEYRYLMESGPELYTKENQYEILECWKGMENEAIQHYIGITENDHSEDREIYGYLQGKVKEHIMRAFNEIFERYGLWYDLDYSWSLSCYYRRKEAYSLTS